MEAFAVVARGRCDLDCVGHQLVERIIRELGRIGPRARRIAALIGRDGAITCRRQRRQRLAPAVARLGEAVQQQDKGAAGRTGDVRGKSQAGACREAGSFDHVSVIPHRSP